MTQLSSTTPVISSKNKDILADLQIDVGIFSDLENAMRQFDEGDSSQRSMNLKELVKRLGTYANSKNDTGSFRYIWREYTTKTKKQASDLSTGFESFELDHARDGDSIKRVDEILENVKKHAVTVGNYQAKIDGLTRRGSSPTVAPPPPPSRDLAPLEKGKKDTLDLIEILFGDLRKYQIKTTFHKESLEASIGGVERELKEMKEKPSMGKVSGLDEFISKSAPNTTYKQMRNALTISILYNALGPSLMDEIKKGINAVTEVSKDPAINGMYASVVNELVANMKSLVDNNSGLMQGINGPLQALSSLTTSIGQFNSVINTSTGTSLSTSNGSSASSPNSNIPMPAFAGNLLYRTVDKIRVLKYKAQLSGFDSSNEGTSLDLAVKTQASRLASIRKELAKRATDIKSRQTAAVENADTTYAVQAGKLKQVRKQHFEACKSFVRAVRNLVTIYVTKLLNFVRYHHGDAIAYMNYWGNVMGDASNGMNAEVKGYITQHQEMCRKIANDANEIANEVVKKTQAALNAPDDILTLDQDDQYVIYEMNMKFNEWAQGQIARVEDSFMTGPPSTIEEFMEPQQIIMYSLKLIRIGIAAISIAAAERMFQSIYRKRVYVYDEDPPNLAWFLGAVLLIDLAIHAIVALVLVIIMHIFARGDNTFPVNSDLIKMWVFDYVVASVPIALILLSTSTVLRFKKYFRYKYEGQRAIRAMAKIAFYTYAVVLPIPFYRMTYG